MQLKAYIPSPDKKSVLQTVDVLLSPVQSPSIPVAFFKNTEATSLETPSVLGEVTPHKATPSLTNKHLCLAQLYGP